MNKVMLTGNLTGEPEVRSTPEGLLIARYTIAVNRVAAKGEQKADFLRCVAFSKKAELAQRYFHKGKKIGVVGRLQTGQYKDADGKTVYTTDIVVEECEFLESKEKEAKQETGGHAPAGDSGFVPVDDFEGLPFQ